MFEFFILIASATPLVVGLYALRRMNERNDDGSEDPPPPPPPEPPEPHSPSSPQGRHSTRLMPRAMDRTSLTRPTTRMPRIPKRTPTAY